MNFYFLDAGGVLLFGSYLLIFLAITILLEWVVLLLFKINRPGKLLLYSFIVNLVSLVLGYVLLPLISEIGDAVTTFINVLRLLIMFAVTFITEGLLLILLNKQNPVSGKKIWLATLFMNIITYIILYFWIT